MKVYAVIRGAGMFALIYIQLYNMEAKGESPWMKLGIVYSWGSVLYWAWAVRASALKKTGNSIKYTNQ